MTISPEDPVALTVTTAIYTCDVDRGSAELVTWLHTERARTASQLLGH